MVAPRRRLSKWTTLERVKCPRCDREVAARVPRGGDGTAVRPVRHNNTEGKPCEGRFDDIC